MKKITTLILILAIAILLPALALAEVIYSGGTMHQTYVCDPEKHLGTVSANVDLRKGAGGDHDITGWLHLCIWPTADGTVTLNGDSTKTIPIYGGMANVVSISRLTTRMVFSVGGPLCGM